MKNGVVLITYADSLGGNLASLHSALKNNFNDCISGVHLLPFFPSSGDRGFSPITYEEIDPEFGSWEDLHSLGEDYEIMADFMVNHISRKSVYFKDWLENEDKSSYSDLFLPVEQVFGTDGPSKSDVEKIYRRQPTDPWLEIRFASGKNRKIWCTFSEEQIDIDITSGSGLKLFRKTLEKLAENGIRTIRLDAVGYITKRKGTSCFMVEPDIWNILERLNKIAGEFDIELLPEMHEHYTIQTKMASHGYAVYDFALPMLFLYSWYASDFNPLINWLDICPRKQFTTLDTHDGIGVVDAADLLTTEQTDLTLKKLYTMGSNVKKKYSSTEYNNVDIYQINCTYFSALGENDDAYIMARAIQFFAPGTPQVYYVGMLAGKNDLELVEKTKNGRDINRHNYSADEIAAESEREVVRRLKKLMKFRIESPAFSGSFRLSNSSDSKTLILEWLNGRETAVLTVDLSDKSILITEKNKSGEITSFRP